MDSDKERILIKVGVREGGRGERRVKVWKGGWRYAIVYVV